MTRESSECVGALAQLLQPLPSEHQLSLVSPQYLDLTILLSISDAASLVPEPSEILEVDFNDFVVLEAHACDHFRATLFTILDAFDLRDHAELVVEAIRDTRMQVMVENLIRGYPDKNWEDVAKQLTNIVFYAASVEFTGRILTAAGKGALDKMLRRFSLALIPYAGPVYITIILLAAIKKNWDFLTC